MSPAGHWPQLQTAIEAGADAVYFGLNHFSARAKVGFDLGELPDVMETLHQRNVKGFVTFNTLVFDHELRQAEAAIEGIAAAGCDAIIVQDTGIAKLAAAVAPDLHVHGSTQMSITSAEGADLAASLGCRRVVLGRELSIKDIRKIASQTDVELEVFVHGALCVSYSGQCFSSEAWGGRSANRGKCAQACRLAYDLIVDGQRKELDDLRYLLSPGDLYAIKQIPELIDIGVACLKIEGRYKDENYVAVTTAAYREAIDLAMAGARNEVSPGERRDIEQVYSRGLGAHFIGGVNHQTVVGGRSPRNRGVHIGTVTDTTRNSVVISVLHEVHRGDGVVFDAASWRSPDEAEEGGHVYEVTRVAGGNVRLEFGTGEIDFSRIRIGDLVWRTRDPQLLKRLKPLTQPSAPIYTQRVDFRVVANLGQPIHVTATIQSGHSASFSGDAPLEPAAKRALDRETLEEKLGRLGGTPYHPGSVDFETTGDVFLPTSQLNQIRRTLVDTLFEQTGAATPIATTPKVNDWIFQSRRDQVEGVVDLDRDPAAEEGLAAEGSLARSTTQDAVATQLHVLLRSKDQLDAAIECRPDSITLDYLELYGLRDSVTKVKDAGLECRVASPRILKPEEQKVGRFLMSLDCGILVRSGGLLHQLADLPDAAGRLTGDFSLNASNFIAMQELLGRGLTRIAPTYDLNGQQVAEVTRYIDSAKLEVIALSHLPIFHTEHCVFCRFLSDGTDHTNCGHPCEKHQITLADGQGRQHPVLADVGCRNTVFNAEMQFDASWIDQWREAGIGHFRIEMVHQSGDEVEKAITAFQAFFAGSRDVAALNRSIQQMASATTQGSLFVADGYKDLVSLQ